MAMRSATTVLGDSDLVHVQSHMDGGTYAVGIACVEYGDNKIVIGQ